MVYCAGDVKATFETFQKLFEIYIGRFTSPITFAGMLEMSTMYLPVNQNWLKYINNCENAYQDVEHNLKNLLEKSANEACEFINEKEHVLHFDFEFLLKISSSNLIFLNHKSFDPWLFDLDWSIKRLNPNFSYKKKDENLPFSYIRDSLETPDQNENVFLRILRHNDLKEVRKN